MNQPHIPPGLTASPQADTACPAARIDYRRGATEMQQEKTNTKGYPPMADVPYIPALKGKVLRNVG